MCSREVHFNNSQCTHCSTLLVYSPFDDRMFFLDTASPTHGGVSNSPGPCSNRRSIGCNWVSNTPSVKGLCLSCLHTSKIPNTGTQENLDRWNRLERAKRRLFYSIIKFALPLDMPGPDIAKSLHFQLLADDVDVDGKPKRVMTGHANGRITINISEADDAIRERIRTAMEEPYRTLIGHFRHEVGHYYWDRLIANKPALDRFRQCFGDERSDYGEALKNHYAVGPSAGWNTSFVSAYASAHPWEDFAETWAHYFHMVEGLETAGGYGINPQPLDNGKPSLVQINNPYREPDIQALVDHWVPLTVSMNAMNRSMGNQDYYPFVLSNVILGKLRFVHELIAAQRLQ